MAVDDHGREILRKSARYITEDDRSDQWQQVGVDGNYLAKQIDVDSGDSTITYVAAAKPGSLTSAASWQIRRITVTGDATAIEWADGDSQFNNVFDDRESLSYS